MSFAHYPPTDGEFVVSALWDKLMRPDWREDATRPAAPRSEETDRKVLAMMREIKEAPPARAGRFDTEQADAVVFERQIPVQRGKWRLLPPEVEEARD